MKRRFQNIMRAKDLAKTIGVSEATLSLVINGKPGISPKTRQKVETQIKELGYGHMLRTDQTAPAAAAASSSKVISFVLYKERGHLLGSNTFFPLILEGIESSARKAGYSLNIINIERTNLEQELSYIIDSGCAGFVVFATEMHEDVIPQFESLGIPFVIFDNEFLDKDLNCVKVNNKQGTWLAAKYLAQMGHKKIGYLSSGLAINSFLERQQYALDAIRHFAPDSGEDNVYTIGYAHENAREGMDALLNTLDVKKLPTAFLVDNDLVAIGAMQSLKAHGYKIPDDFSFVGYDDRPICTLTDPPLTTIQLPRERFGAAAVELLIKHLEEAPSSRVTIEINSRLIVRDSVSNRIIRTASTTKNPTA